MDGRGGSLIWLGVKASSSSGYRSYADAINSAFFERRSSIYRFAFI